MKLQKFFNVYIPKFLSSVIQFLFVTLVPIKLIFTSRSYHQLNSVANYIQESTSQLRTLIEENKTLVFNRKLHNRKISKKELDEISLVETMASTSMLAQFHHYLGDSRKTGFYNLILAKKKQEERMQTFGANSNVFLDPGWTSSIGHLGLLSMFIRFKEINVHSDAKSPIVLNITPNNNILLNLYAKHLNIVPFRFELHGHFRTQFQLLNNLETEIGNLDLYAAFNYAMKQTRYKQLFDLPEKVKESGFSFLNKFGFSEKDWFVTFHIRETKNNDELSNPSNPSISSYVYAMKHVIDIGGWVVRVGNQDMTPLPENIKSNPRVIDFAQMRDQTECLNLFFLGACRVMVATESGPKLIPSLFGRPCLVTNLHHVSHCHDLPGYTIPQLIYSSNKKQVLNLRDSLAIPLGWNNRREALGYVRHENSPEDILEGLKCVLHDYQNSIYNERGFGEFRSLENSAKISPSFLSRYPNYLE